MTLETTQMTSNERAQAMEKRLIKFGVDIIKLCREMPNDIVGRHLAKQILRSGTAPALLYAEARGAESDKDFRHKCSLVLKESRETHVNLQLIHGAEVLPQPRIDPIEDEANQLVSIYVRTVQKMDERIRAEEAKKKKK